ncbi:MAG: metal ABC transporter substrate-binding protein [Actinomycetes bacterium]
MSRRDALVLGLAGALLAAGCGPGSSDSDDSRTDVVASFYPLAFLAERVGGAAADVANLTAPGVEAHDLELTPRQVGDLVESDLVLYEKGLQPAVDDAVGQADPSGRLDATEIVPLRETHGTDEGHGSGDDPHEAELGAVDPHVWLDPTLMARLATAVGQELARVDPAHADGYRTRARQLVHDLKTLDRQFETGLDDCQRHLLVTSHASFGYLAERYGLEQLSVSGLTPDADPTPGRLAEVQRVVEQGDVTTIFVERLVSPRVVESLASDTGLDTAVLDPLEGVAHPGRDDYLSVMRDNLGALRHALGCR